MGRPLLPALLLPLVLLSAAPARAASFEATWLGGVGDWEDAASWSGTVVPHNSGGDSYDARIDGGNTAASRVTLSSPETIGTLEVDAGDALELTSAAQLTFGGNRLANAGELLLHGVGDFYNAALLFTLDGSELSGGGVVRMDGGGLRLDDSGPVTPSLVNVDNTIRGWGTINGAGFLNQGTIEADVPGQTLTIVGGANDGTVRAIGGASAAFGVSGTGFINRGVVEVRDGSSFRQSDRTSSLGASYSATGASTMQLAGSFIDTEFSTDGDSEIRFVGGDLPFLENARLEGNFVGAEVRVSGTLLNLGTFSGGIDPLGAATVDNQGHVALDWSAARDAADVLTLQGGGTVALGVASPAELRAPLRNLDNRMSGRGFVAGLVENGGVIEASNGELDLRARAGGTSHSGTFAAVPGGTLQVEGSVAGPGDWLADGGLIRVTGQVVTTGDAIVRNGGQLSVVTLFSTDDLLVDSTSSLDVQGVLRVVGDLDFEGANGGRWSFASGSFFEARGGVGAAVGDWHDWQSLEAAGRDLGLLAAGFTSGNFYLPSLVIGPDGHLVLRDGRDNANRAGGAEAVYVDTLVFSDSLGLLNLNGIRLYYNHLVGSPSQIIDVLVPAPEPEVGWLFAAALGALGWLRYSAARQGGTRRGGQTGAAARSVAALLARAV